MRAAKWINCSTSVRRKFYLDRIYEFGGPAGVTAILMVGFPISMYPNAYAWKVYTGIAVYQLFLALVMPGYQQETLIYNCNAPYSLYALYDVLMGACLTFRIGSVDLKMWAEVRIPWVIVFLLAVSGSCHQYEQYGYVTPNMAFMILATGLYFNAWCREGEECIPQTWDMYHEKWGFVVIFWNFAGVPFTYVYSVVYMASHDPCNYQFSTPAYVILFAVLLTAYYIWDASLTQKSRFKMQTQGITTFRDTFPNRLLISGWWRYSRKPNYVADWTTSLCLGAVIASASITLYFYSYGKDWAHYYSIVKCKFIFGIY
ncbi:hypothetical protein BDR04DRAFT_1091234 [Suillus decipiens]|nr:hypothetical protein BDR04DRAFT_1091234 [Suillus decipiens]